MYRRKNKGWLKHLDFIILDLLCLQVCFALAYFSRHGLGGNPHKVIYFLLKEARIFGKMFEL